jgi:chaperone required for assembly of F1-ATPase
MGSSGAKTQIGPNAPHDPRLHRPRSNVQSDAYRKQVLNYVLTHTVCYWADPTTDRILYRRQEEAWNDLYAHIESSFGETMTKAMGAPEGMIMARNSVTAGTSLTKELQDKCRAWVDTLDAWHLTALYSATSEAKSFCVAWALLDQQQVQQHEQEKSIHSQRRRPLPRI